MEQWRILLADDDAEDRGIIKDAFDELHFPDVIRFAENGEEALKIISEVEDTQFKPSLIVLDLNMPRLNGTETLRQIKADKRLENVPVIIFSTSINSLEKEKCMKLGAHSYITKPISYKECTETAAAFLAFCHDPAATV